MFFYIILHPEDLDLQVSTCNVARPLNVNEDPEKFIINHELRLHISYPLKLKLNISEL